MSKQIYRNNWISCCIGFNRVTLTVDKAGYFDERPQLNITPTIMIPLIALPLFGFTMFTIPLLILFIYGYGKLYIHLPFKTGIQDCENPSYGFYWYGEDASLYIDTLWIRTGKGWRTVNMPWQSEWYRTSKLLKDKTWDNQTKKNKHLYGLIKNKKGIHETKKLDLYTEKHKYSYTRRCGEVQNAVATVGMTEREWRPKWLYFTKLFNFTRRVIDIDFDTEIGEGAGSWKGGVVGCSHDIKKGETMLQCFRRFEKEVRFNR